MKADAVIDGRKPRRGDYLIHRGLVKTYGRVVRVTRDALVWFSNTGGSDVRSDPESLRLKGYEYSERPLPDYVPIRPFPYLELYPETEPEPIPANEAEAAAIVHAEKGDPARAAALFDFTGNDEAAALCRSMAPKWR